MLDPLEELALSGVPGCSRTCSRSLSTAGFGYQFGALEKSDNALGRAFSHMFSPRAGAHKPTPFMLVRGRFIGFLIRALPVLKIAEWIPNERIRQVRDGFRVVQTESENIIRSKQDDVVAKDGLDSTRGSKDLIALLRALLYLSLSLARRLSLTVASYTVKSVQSEGKSSMTDEELRGQLTVSCLG